ncbi:ABC transporter ATP-binding protein [bacterium]|nr:ABC transporter ATP-binding protein [bacterium]
MNDNENKTNDELKDLASNEPIKQINIVNSQPSKQVNQSSLDEPATNESPESTQNEHDEQASKKNAIKSFLNKLFPKPKEKLKVANPELEKYVNQIKDHLHQMPSDLSISELSGRKFLVFDPNDPKYPIDKNYQYRSDILKTIPKYIANETTDDIIKNDQPYLISVRRKRNEQGYEDEEKNPDASATLKPLIAIKNLCMVFKRKNVGKVYAVNNISFDINYLENLAFIGANGAGKTTTVEIIAGINKPTSGTIDYNFKYKKSFQEQIGIQFQDSSYPRGITVKNVIEFMRDAQGVDKERMSDEEFDELLDIFKIKEFYNLGASKLSGGQQQRLNVLLSLMHKPKVIFLDELATGLDIQIRHKLEEFVQQ